MGLPRTAISEHEIIAPTIGEDGRMALGRRLALGLSSALVGAAFAIDVVGGRWASYISTPLPGLYLADALLLLGAVVALFTWTPCLRPERWLTWSYGIVLVYLAVVVLPEFGRIDAETRYLALRDAAPFQYLALVPLLALGLRRVSGRAAVIWLRGATVGLLIGALAVSLGLVHPFSASWLGSPFAQVLGYRTDLTGAALAAGLVAWQAIPTVGLRGSRAVQVGYLFAAGVTIESRSGMVAVLVAILVIATSTRNLIRGSLIVLLGGVLLLAGSAVVSFLPADSGGSTSNRPAAAAMPSPAPASGNSNAEPAILAPEIPLSDVWVPDGTVLARIQTWQLILSGLARDRSWLFGGSAGSDYMYELCTGLKVAPPVLSPVTADPKCPVDDYGPEPPVRDPHNWLLNIALTHGVLGLLVFIACISATLWRARRSVAFPQAAWTVGFFLITGLTFLISGGYALLPISVSLAWMASREGWDE